MKHFFLAIGIFFFIATLTVQAVKPYQPRSTNPILEPWRWTRFPYLTGKGVHCVAEANDGTIWFGINYGILRYDGLNWKSYGEEQGLTSTPVLDIICLAGGASYLYTHAGIYQLINDRWIQLLKIDIKHRGNIPAILKETSDGSVWLGTQYGMLRLKDGLFSFFRKEGIEHIPPEVHHYERGPMLVENVILFYESVAEDQRGGLWFGVSTGHFYYTGRYIYQPEFWKFHESKFNNHWSGSKIFQASDGKIWMIFESNVRDNLIYDPELDTWSQFRLGYHDGSDLNASIIETDDNRIWIGGYGKLHSYYQGEWEVYHDPEVPLPQAYIRIVQARDGSVWVFGYKNDVYRIDYSKNRWQTYDDLHFQCETRNGDQWFISVDHGVVRFDGHKWEYFDKSDGLIEGPVTLYVTKNDQLWAAGYHHHEAATAVFIGEKWSKQVHYNVANSIDYRAVFESKDGSMWFGAKANYDPLTDKRGVLRYNPAFGPPDSSAAWQHIYKESKQRHETRYMFIRGIGQRSDGLIFFTGRQNYIFTYDGSTFGFYDGTEAFVKDPVDFQLSTGKGELLFGTRSEGLFHYNDQNVWVQYTVENGLSSNTIMAILLLDDNSLLVATDKDICRFDGRNWTKNVFPSMFNINRSGGSMKQSKDNRIWINQATESWYLLCDPRYKHGKLTYDYFWTVGYQPENKPPETEIFQYETKVSRDGNTTIFWQGQDYWNKTPSISLQYSYKLDNDDWTPFTSQMRYTFLSLPSGRHVFQVRARDRDLNIDPVPDQIEFMVAYPVWREPWFLMLIALMIALIFVYEIRVYKSNRRIHQLDMMKLRLFTNISHEFRTPLTLILGPLEKLLVLHRNNPPLYKQFELMQRNANRLLRLVNQVMNFRKIEVGKLKLELSKGDLIHFIRGIAYSFQLVVKEKDTEIEFTTTIESLNIWFDSDMMDNIIFNLLSNAYKFTPKAGHIRISISLVGNEWEKQENLKRTPMPDKLVQIQIRDTGIGIASDQLDHIFERYYQVEDPRAKGVQGTGIGLSMVKDLVELHKGTIKVESKRGEGTCFTIRLPLEVSDDQDAKASNNLENPFKTVLNSETKELNSAREGSRALTKSQILLIDDSRDIRHFIRDELEDEFRIIEADDGQTGFETAVFRMPDLIVCDILMPGIDGFQVCQKLKHDERTSHIPIILLTALNTEESILEGWKTGGDDYVTKPFSILLLKSRINNLIHSRQKLRARFGKEIYLQPKDITITSTDEKFLQRTIDIVEKHMYDQEFSVDQFIQEMNMSKSPFYQKIKALTDQTPSEFVRNLKLKRAAEMLSKGKMQVSEVAYELGFNNLSYFSKSYRKLFGESPSSYMNKYEK